MGTRWLWMAVVAVGMTACAPKGRYVWVDTYEEELERDPAYVILADDVLSVRVLNNETMTTRVRVRSDGRISLPFLNDVRAAGMLPAELARHVQNRFEQYVRNPVVTVTLEESKPFTVSVVGEVTNPGVYALEPRSGVLHALASAGGFTQYAHESRIFVLRRTSADAPPTRIRFTYEALTQVEGKASTFKLQRNDVVVVE